MELFCKVSDLEQSNINRRTNISSKGSIRFSFHCGSDLALDADLLKIIHNFQKSVDTQK